MFCTYRNEKLARPAWTIYCVCSVCAFFQLWWHYLKLPWSISPQPCNPEQRKWSHKTIFCFLTVIFEFAEKHKANSYWVLWVPHCIVCKPKPPTTSESSVCHGSLFSVGPYFDISTNGRSWKPESENKNFLMETMLKSFQHNGFSGKFLWWGVIKRSLIILNSICGLTPTTVEN